MVECVRSRAAAATRARERRHLVEVARNAARAEGTTMMHTGACKKLVSTSATESTCGRSSRLYHRPFDPNARIVDICSVTLEFATSHLSAAATSSTFLVFCESVSSKAYATAASSNASERFCRTHRLQQCGRACFAWQGSRGKVVAVACRTATEDRHCIRAGAAQT